MLTSARPLWLTSALVTQCQCQPHFILTCYHVSVPTGFHAHLFPCSDLHRKCAYTCIHKNMNDCPHPNSLHCSERISKNPFPRLSLMTCWGIGSGRHQYDHICLRSLWFAAPGLSARVPVPAPWCFLYKRCRGVLSHPKRRRLEQPTRRQREYSPEKK